MATPDVVIRALGLGDFPRADTVRRLAFGTFFGLAVPMTFRGTQTPDWTRFLTDPSGSFAAEINGKLIGTNFAVSWGSLGLVGPVSVHPDYWNRGIAQILMQPVLNVLERRGTHHLGLFTLPQSPKHIGLYQKFGFWPRFLTLIMSKSVSTDIFDHVWEEYSTLPAAQQQTCLDHCRELTNATFEGLDLSVEIVATHEHRFGETILLWDGDTLAGFAVCHCGPQTEAGSDSCYVKFGAVHPGPEAETRFKQLLTACDSLAATRGMSRILAGVNTARREAYRLMLEAGFRADVQGLAMQCPDEAAYNRPGVYVIDDWR